ncbi:MAG: DUF190 domain-containing protein [bacterium]|nr:DUF190 domain-containing protein [bacterium]
MAISYSLIEIFTSEGAMWQGKPLTTAVVNYVADQKIALRCIVFRGLAGCYENGEIAVQDIVILSLNMPVKVEIILPTTQLEAVLPHIEEMVQDGIVSVRDAGVRFFRSRKHLIPKHLKVRDAMTPSPKAVGPATPVADVIRLLLSSPFNGLPVIDSDGRVIGIITQKDLIKRAGMPLRLGLLAEMDEMDKEGLESFIGNAASKTAAEIMTSPAVTVKEDTYLSDAVEIMLGHSLKRLPVVDNTGKLTGILARIDVFRVIAREVPHWQKMATCEVDVRGLHYVSDIVNRGMHTVHPGASLDEVADAIAGSDGQRVVVVDEAGCLLGIISDKDLLRALSGHKPGLWDYLLSKLSFTETGQEHKELIKDIKAGTADEIMKTDVISVHPDTTIDEAINLMVDKGLKRLPVVDAQGEFQGLISRDAILRLGMRKNGDDDNTEDTRRK